MKDTISSGTYFVRLPPIPKLAFFLLCLVMLRKTFRQFAFALRLCASGLRADMRLPPLWRFVILVRGGILNCMSCAKLTLVEDMTQKVFAVFSSYANRHFRASTSMKFTMFNKSLSSERR